MTNKKYDKDTELLISSLIGALEGECYEVQRFNGSKKYFTTSYESLEVKSSDRVYFTISIDRRNTYSNPYTGKVVWDKDTFEKLKIEKTMKYFEVKEPYYALIKAENKEKAKEVYEKIMCDIDEDEEVEFMEITEDEAWKLFSDPEAQSEFEKRTEEEMRADFHDEGVEILLVDGSLI